MVFSSIQFLFYFMPIVMVGYFLTPDSHKNKTLFASSLIFYFFGEPIYIGLLLFSIMIDYFHSRIIDHHFGSKKATTALMSSIILNVGLLSIFKYSDFIIQNTNKWFSTEIPLLDIPLPIGISFFTFQTMSYTIDVYRGHAKAQTSFLGLGTYVSLFPQLIAGPIVRYRTISKDLIQRQHNFDKGFYGITRFIIGLSKKVILANSFAVLANEQLAASQPDVLLYWLSGAAYMLQIYYDFSGYSDMAIGLGSIFGFRFPENFNYPYSAGSITEFWRRWHMTLGQWFRDYVYIPLGGNQKSPLRTLFNLFIVWALTGLWHGASWNYVLWGTGFAVILGLEKKYLLNLLAKFPKGLGHIYVVMVMLLSFVLFRFEDLSVVSRVYQGMFGLSNLTLMSQESLYLLKSYKVVLVLGIIGSTPMVANITCLFTNQMKGAKWIGIVEVASLFFLFLLSTSYLVDGSFNPFLYFRF
jgi:alginate O-acetyltransferase complex protein AlgI